jgi:Spy/CpxP family protein refolding chaperone
LNPSQKPLFWTAAAVVLAALTAYVVARQTAEHHEGHAHVDPQDDSGDDFHEWLHSQLEITPEQESQLAPIERSYAEKRGTLLKVIEDAGHELAKALELAQVDRAEIDTALAKIHNAQGELQQVTIGHFLEMKEALSPEQAAKLLRWTRESITHEHRP